MENTKNISQYRNRLDSTLACRELTNVETIKKLVRDQLHRSLEHELEDSIDNIVEKRTKEVFNCLQMLNTTSDYGALQGRDMHHRRWKLKQDSEEYRVMYREGPEGTPFHELLLEGYVDGPLDVCLCISWESNLYRKWWPQSSIPTFKILTSECLQKIRIGEQICLVRVKVSWPLSTREAVVHFFEFEFFQDDLIVVLFNSIADSESIDRSRDGFSRDVIPEKQDFVRIDLVGGMAMQKVTADRSYFRTIANMDMKLEFVPPSIINFISRQLIGSGFKLYQKEVASVCRGDVDFSKALQDPLHSGIREALYSDKRLREKFESENGDGISLPENDVLRHHDLKIATEIEEEDVQVEQSSTLETNASNIRHVVPDSKYDNSNKRKVNVSPQVKQALETLQRAILILREYSSSDPPIPRASGSFRKTGVEKLKPLVDGKIVGPKGGVSADVSKDKSMERTSQEHRSSIGSHSSRGLGSSPYLREANHSNKIVPASPGGVNVAHRSETQQIVLHNDEFSFHKTWDEASPVIDKIDGEDKRLVRDTTGGVINLNSSKAKHRRLRRYCCWHFSSTRLLSGGRDEETRDCKRE